MGSPDDTSVLYISYISAQMRKVNIRSVTILSALILMWFGCSEPIGEDSTLTVTSQIEGLIQRSKNRKLDYKERLAYLDTARSLLKLPFPAQDSLEMEILYAKGLIYYSSGQIDNFYHTNKELAKIALTNGSQDLLGKASFNLGYYFDELTHRPDSAFFYYQQAKNSYLKSSNRKGLFEVLENIAILQSIQNDFFGTKETLTEAISISNDDTSRASIYNELATNHRKLLNYKDAVTYYQRAIENANSPNKAIKYKNNLATLFTDMSDYDSAILLFEEIIQENALNRKSTTYARILDNYTYTRWKNGDNDVEAPFYRALQIRKENKDIRGQIASFSHLGEYLGQEKPQLSKKYLDTVIQLSRQLRTPKAEADALHLLMNLAPENLAFRNRYIFLKDSMYTNELKVKTQFAKMKYDDEQEKEKILALEAETSLRRAELAEQKTQKIILISLAGFLLLGGTAFLYLLQQRHRKEKLEEVYNTEKRISQDLHDGLANDIFGLMTQLQNKEKKDSEIINHLEKLYQTTRLISHENSEIRTGPDFKEELNGLIANYQHHGMVILVKGLSNIDWAHLETHKCVVVHRSVQELLVNMKKHSQATLVSLQFEQKKKQIKIIYTDNGVGFTQKTKRGIGLMNTENRIQALGGTIIFESKQGSGAKIKISIPV
ncbi:tetratricopeptide repeat-containing sensor histidine kinase [Pareuzebyella sediminis]|uniref:tetratricopeptide repeat-containing sensor histidine kinase n=1 Tax=Pareuzebyella sediminis TaxID=2607998 RepID=UPI0011F01A75|nr:tetratricopeptide repeat-containing sensor histidine kinase [Pareuzebyella sediminis]